MLRQLPLPATPRFVSAPPKTGASQDLGSTRTYGFDTLHITLPLRLSATCIVYVRLNHTAIVITIPSLLTTHGPPTSPATTQASHTHMVYNDDPRGFTFDKFINSRKKKYQFETRSGGRRWKMRTPVGRESGLARVRVCFIQVQSLYLGPGVWGVASTVETDRNLATLCAHKKEKKIGDIQVRSLKKL